MENTVITNYEIQVPLDDINIITLDRGYVETKCQWREQYDRVASWMLDKDRVVQ